MPHHLTKLAHVLLAVLPLAAGAMLPACAAGGQKVAVFPFELLDQSQEGGIILKVDPAETRRLEILTADLKARLAASKAYESVDVSGLAADIKAAAPLHKCAGCEAELARKAGASFAMLGLVQKFSDTLLSVSIQVIDAQTGAVKGSYSAGVQGNTDEAWLRGVSYLVRNRILAEGASQ